MFQRLIFLPNPGVVVMILSLVGTDGKQAPITSDAPVANHLDTFTLVIRSTTGMTRDELLKRLEGLDVVYAHHDEKTKTVSR